MAKKVGAVCLIDDDPHFCGMVSQYLEENHYDVEVFHNGADALEALTTWLPNVILLDLDMPGLSGLEVLQKIQERFSRIPVVMITAIDDVRTVVAAVKAGAFDYLVKPVQEARLITVTRNALDRQRLTEEIGELQRCGSEAGFMGMVGSSPVMMRRQCPT